MNLQHILRTHAVFSAATRPRKSSVQEAVLTGMKDDGVAITPLVCELLRHGLPLIPAFFLPLVVCMLCLRAHVSLCLYIFPSLFPSLLCLCVCVCVRARVRMCVLQFAAATYTKTMYD